MSPSWKGATLHPDSSSSIWVGGYEGSFRPLGSMECPGEVGVCSGGLGPCLCPPPEGGMLQGAGCVCVCVDTGPGCGLLTGEQQLGIHVIHHLCHGLGLVAGGVPCARWRVMAAGWRLLWPSLQELPQAPNSFPPTPTSPPFLCGGGWAGLVRTPSLAHATHL